jgi:hypothetical protein
VCAGTALLVLTAEIVACDGAALPLPSTEPGVLRNFCKKSEKRSKKSFFSRFSHFFPIFSFFCFVTLSLTSRHRALPPRRPPPRLSVSTPNSPVISV